MTGQRPREAWRRGVPPGFDAVAEVLAAGGSPLAACAVAGRALACDGASLGEALSGLSATFAALGGAAPDFASVQALAVAWSEATLDFLHDVTCEDPLTGLASLAHLRTRLAEVYREAELHETSVRRSHGLVVVEAAREGTLPDAPFSRALGMAAVADVLRATLPGGLTVARAGGRRVVALTRRDAGLGASVALARTCLDDLELPPEVRVWIEGLPEDPDLAGRLLSDLAR